MHEDPEVIRIRETLARLESRLAYGKTEPEIWEAVVPDPPPDPHESLLDKYARWSNRELEDDAERLRAELRAQHRHPMADPARPVTRKAIPQAVKVAVAARDGGRCQCRARSCGHVEMCGSTEEPHFDHIIPWSKGGTDTVDNLQILCGPCNRRKGADDIT